MLSHFLPTDLSPMDLFHFTMQQLAPTPVSGSEGDAHTLPSYLRHWLHRHYYTSEPPLRAAPLPGSLLKLDVLVWSKLRADVTEFYGLQLPRRGLEGFSTIENLESYVLLHLRQAAA